MQRVLSFPASRGPQDPGEFVTKRMCCSFLLSVAFLALISGFLLGRFVFDQELELSRMKLKKAFQQQPMLALRNFSKLNYSDVTEVVSVESLLQDITELSNRSTTRDAPGLHQAQVLQAHFRAAGFDLVSRLVQSQIHLSFLNQRLPNRVVVVDGRGNMMVECEDARPAFTQRLATPTQNLSSVVEGPVVYVNFGRDEDYHYLDGLNTGVSVSGKVVLARAGAIPAADMVNIALDHEAKGVIIFLDPQQRGASSTQQQQQLLTAVELARLQALHSRQNDNDSVPVLVISASDAEKILKEMSSNDPSPESWRGALKSSYPIGAGFSDPAWKLTMYVHTVSFVKTYYDVLAVIRGSQEPDRLVMLGSERDPWLLDEGDHRATAVLMETARALGELKRSKDWRPRRSIVLSSWGLDTPDQHLSLHSETWWTHLELRTVAYLKVDAADFSNETLVANGAPLLDQVVRETASLAGLSVSSTMEFLTSVGSKQLLTQHGVPFLQFRPARVLNESRNVQESVLSSVTTFWTSLVWQLADSPRLPFQVETYRQFLLHSMNVLNTRFESVAKRHTLFIETLAKSVDRLVTGIRTFQSRLVGETQDTVSTRVVNDQMLRFAHALSCHSDRMEHLRLPARHIILSPSTTGGDPTAGFGVLQDLLRELTSADTPDDLQRQIVTHVAMLVQCLDSAAYALTDGLDGLVAAE